MFRSKRLRTWLVNAWARVRHFLAEVPGSLRDHLNAEELLRIAVVAATTGGGFFGFLNAVLQQTPAVFPSPADAALAGALLTAILDAARRLRHGEDPSVRRMTSAHRR